ncbi:MAG: signal peptidase II [Candidatus Omnitrophota bacterium]
MKKINLDPAAFFIVNIILSASFVFLDQVSKFVALRLLNQNQSIPLIKDFLHITLVYNTGSAFGLLRNQNWILTYISILAIIFILWLMVRQPQFKSRIYLQFWQFALLLILSGATGNLIDRIYRGFVVDFIDVRIWPIFNLADTMITCGVFLLILILFNKKAFE